MAKAPATPAATDVIETPEPPPVPTDDELAASVAGQVHMALAGWGVMGITDLRVNELAKSITISLKAQLGV